MRVFADLGLPNARQELMKARLTLQIYRIVRQRGMTQTQAARVLGIKQPHVSLLMRIGQVVFQLVGCWSF